MSAVVVRQVYVPSFSRAQMNAARARRKAPLSKMQSMQEFLLSDNVQDVAVAAAEDMAGEAVMIAIAEIYRDTTRAYVESIDARATTPRVIGGRPRAAAVVTAHGGTQSWGGFKDPESSHAAVVEFGNPAAAFSGRRIFGRVAAKYTTPKRGVG